MQRDAEEVFVYVFVAYFGFIEFVELSVCVYVALLFEVALPMEPVFFIMLLIGAAVLVFGVDVLEMAVMLEMQEVILMFAITLGFCPSRFCLVDS